MRARLAARADGSPAVAPCLDQSALLEVAEIAA